MGAIASARAGRPTDNIAA